MSNFTANDIFYWAFRDVDQEKINRTLDRWKKDEILVEHETPFGTFRMIKHPKMPDNEVWIGNNKIIIDGNND